MKTQTKQNKVMKTIDINAREWLDKTYGNSYFSAIVTGDYYVVE